MRYYVLVTTAAGLYRYFMNDLIEVTGQYRRTPVFRFVQKGRGVTSLTGEKLYEAQVIQAVQDVSRRFGVAAAFFVLVAREDSASYTLYIEGDEAEHHVKPQLEAGVDERLGELNLEYHGKRASGRLEPVTVAWLRRGAAADYKAACVRNGQREGQFKPAVLQYARQLPLSLDAYVVA